MAASGAMADFARMPPQRKAMVFIVAGVVLGLGYWKFVYQPLAEKVEAAEAENQTKRQTDQKLAEDIPKYQELREQMTTLRQLIEQNESALPSEAELAAFIETLQHKVTESGVETRKWTYRNPEPVETFVKVPFEVEMTGTFMQIKRFFASLVQRDVRLSRAEDEQAGDEHDRIVSIENLALTNPVVQNREIIMTAKFTAVTFRQEDRAAAPAGQPAGARPGAAPAPARPLPPPPPGSGPPPLPSATTPSGAKARVEGAVEKGDARTRSATGAAGADGKPAAGGDRLKGGL
jgi:Tfp pilus assembly protein PilO